ncbi:DegT/DnrJ/EryC1/StrS family aminotransferase [Eilatimonas milleporae]|uniref:dTDP-4-amino-4,6-dideoxygalactose transaminase n=1 Tax=Eilatimonas milleporae TaxID=911205 RepID=A0A3M0BTW6_9PROT|nr:DegT/DnrJ/EryC1/StrS family aminotransferase [Eilatimonas milleporae]RMB00662.1 dTDP-4-amino-4,6-dideoxygalactose transaminase [Eilatimonas milleporae]
MIKFLDLKAVHRPYRAELESRFAAILDSGRYVLGAQVVEFEERFARFTGARQAVGVGNGLDALSLALKALDIGHGDRVLVPSFTFIATWLSVMAAGAEPVPVPVSLETGNMDPSRLPVTPDSRVKAIVPVHLYGAPADMTAIGDYARRHGLRIVADAAQAHGARYDDRPVGDFADISTYSFYPGKNLGALGDAGAITVNDDGLAARLRRLRNYGSDKKYIHGEAGTNSRLDELQAAFLNVRLDHLDAENAVRREQAAHYGTALAPLAGIVDTVRPPGNSRSAHHLFVIRCDKRDALLDVLTERDIQCQIHYPVAPCDQQAFAHMTADAGIHDTARQLAATVLSLPLGPHLCDEDISEVCDAVTASAVDLFV